LNVQANFRRDKPVAACANGDVFRAEIGRNKGLAPARKQFAEGRNVRFVGVGIAVAHASHESVADDVEMQKVIRVRHDNPAFIHHAEVEHRRVLPVVFNNVRKRRNFNGVRLSCRSLFRFSHAFAVAIGFCHDFAGREGNGPLRVRAHVVFLLAERFSANDKFHFVAVAHRHNAYYVAFFPIPMGQKVHHRLFRKARLVEEEGILGKPAGVHNPEL
jgi:hypothetical protein